MGECSQEGEEQESLLSLSAQRVGQLGDQGGAWPSAFPHAELAWEPTHQPGSHQPVCFLQTQTVQHNKEMTLASNRSLAEGNLLYQPQLDAQKARLTPSSHSDEPALSEISWFLCFHQHPLFSHTRS